MFNLFLPRFLTYPSPVPLSLRLLLPPLLWVAVLLLLSLLLEGCQTAAAPSGTAPATALQTFDALYQNAVAADDLVNTTGTTALAAGLISAAQAQQILNVTDTVKTALDAANAAAQAGNTGGAVGSLAAALGPIAILSSCLTTKPLTVATFAACAVKLAPAATS